MTIDRSELQASGMLAGVRVVEFAQNAAVPQCARLFAGMGADVIKVEPPTGDAMRHLAPIAPDESRAYSTINPGKRAISLDLASPDARPVVDELLAWADIALLGLKADDLPRYGLDWERIHDLNSALVVLAFNAYGPEGPYASAPGYDMLIQAVSGIGFSMNRSKDGAPLPTRPAFIDFASGSMAAAAVLAALRHRDQTGTGQRVDVSLLGTALALGTPMLANFEADAVSIDSVREEVDLLRTSGADFDEWRDHYESRVLAGGGLFKLYVRPYTTADGLISIAGFSPALMARFHELTGLDRIPPGKAPADPEFAAVIEAAEALFLTKKTDDWIDALGSIGYPSARYNYPQEAIEHEQAEVNDYVVDLEHPAFGTYRTIGMPFAFSDSPTGISGPSPGLGEHTRSVLAELGFATETIDALAESGTIIEMTTGDD